MTFVCGHSGLIRLVNSNPLMLGIIFANPLGTAYCYDLPTREEWNADGACLPFTLGLGKQGKIDPSGAHYCVTHSRRDP
jgi:hypothetical protein